MKDSRENIDLFDDITPLEGHEQRFITRFDNYKRKRLSIRRQIITISSTVTVVAAMIIAGIFFSIQSKQLPDPQQELSLLIENYTDNLNMKLDRLKIASENMDSTTRESLLSDIGDIKKENKVFVKKIETHNLEASKIIIKQYFTLQEQGIDRAYDLVTQKR